MARYKASVKQPYHSVSRFTMVSPNSNLTIVALQIRSNDNIIIPFECPCPSFDASFRTKTPVVLRFEVIAAMNASQTFYCAVNNVECYNAD
ncbi:hypothetical protein TNCV_3847241 [Trichonephila clavipes]|nr:hypothetical protein TNCV_3847241 [Trichonephila clavipes]